MTEDQWLAISNLTRLRVVSKTLMGMVFTDPTEIETHTKWQHEVWQLIYKYEKQTKSYISTERSAS